MNSTRLKNNTDEMHVFSIYGRDRSAHDAFLDIRDGGWSTPALGFLSQLGVLIVTMNGFDSQVHIGMLHVQGSFIGKKHSVDAHAAEETKDADTAIPTSLGWSVSLNAVSGVILTLILVLKTGGLERIVENATGLPSINLMFDLSGIPILTTCLVVTIIIALCGSAIECLTTASRQIWALGRDNGLPFSDRLQTVSIPTPTLLGLGVCTHHAADERTPCHAQGSCIRVHLALRAIVTDQHFLSCRADRHPLTGHRQPHVVVHDLYWLCCAKAHSW